MTLSKVRGLSKRRHGLESKAWRLQPGLLDVVKWFKLKKSFVSDFVGRVLQGMGNHSDIFPSTAVRFCPRQKRVL